MIENEDLTGSALGVMNAQLTQLHGAKIIEVMDPHTEMPALAVPLALLPTGKRLESLEKLFEPYRVRPIRRKGTAKIRDIASFTAHVNAFKDADSAVFSVDTPRSPKLLAVYDYNPKGGIDAVKPRFGSHRAEYAPQLSDQWRAWTEREGQQMLQGDFAEFIEDHFSDVVLIDGPHINEVAQLLEARVGGPSSLLKLSRGLQVSANLSVSNAVTLSTGEVQVNFTETHSEGGGPITTPNLFFLAIPVFHGGEAYQVPVRLRYRLAGGKLAWSFALYRADQIFLDAFKGLVAKVAAECEIAVYAGEPEA